MVTSKASLQERPVFSALSHMKKMLHALAGYSKSYSCQVSVKGTAQRYICL